MKKYFVVSDIHSFYDILIETLKKNHFNIDDPEHYFILCGDLFDRGLQSKELLNFVQSLGDRFIYIRGNHEDLLFECVYEIAQGLSVQSHHISNGTLATIAQLTDVNIYELLNPRRSEEFNRQIFEKMRPILNWIDEKSFDYYELNNYIFVHGWIPCICDDPVVYFLRKNYKFDPNWNIKPDKNDISGVIKYKTKWKEARWINGMEAWYQGIKIPDKTIVCGHFHCSWGWSHLDQKRKEFPDKNKKDWKKSFEPYIKEGIIALDACTAYSGIVNCYTFEVE